MDFDIPASHVQLRQRVREFCQREIGPKARYWDRERTFPIEIVPRLAELGLLGINVPIAYGGAGLDTLALVISIEELAKVDGSLALTVASHNSLGLQHILAVGTEEQRQRYLARAATGQCLAAWALTEPSAGSDGAAIETTASPRGDQWLLRGSKTYISQGSVAGFCVVLARTNPAGGARGMTAFIVERGTAGFSVTRKIDKFGCRASDTAEIALVDCVVTDSARLGAVGAAFYDAMRLLDRGRIAVAAMALGIGRAALAAALDYAERRKTFGRSISQHQAIQLKIADGLTGLDAAELLVHRAAWLVDQGLPCTAQASMAKLFASEAATRVCNDAMQIHGGFGYTLDCDVERFLRDAKVCEIAEGTSEIQRMIIARHAGDR